MIELYRGWEIAQSAEPVHGKFEATSPDYDVDCDQDGFFVCGGCVLTSDSIEELKEAIDDYILENQCETCEGSGRVTVDSSHTVDSGTKWARSFTEQIGIECPTCNGNTKKGEL